MNVMARLNSGTMYLICGGIIAFVAAVCVIFALRAWRAGKAIGMDTSVMLKVIRSSASFSVLPAVAILLGVIALSGALGVPWPWLRLSVIGALHYETQVAHGAAEQVGIELAGEAMTARAFSTIALLMSACIMWGMVLRRGESKGPSFGDTAMTAMFIGLVSAYIGSYVGSLISGHARFDLAGDPVPLLCAAAAAVGMMIFTRLSKVKGLKWLEDFSLALAMLAGMAAAILFRMLFPAAGGGGPDHFRLIRVRSRA